MNVKVANSSATTLPAFNPILPPAGISTVILVSNPSKVCYTFLKMFILVKIQMLPQAVADLLDQIRLD